MAKPLTSEYMPFHETYISKVGEGDIIQILSDQGDNTYKLLKSIPQDKALYAYADGKWTIKQVIGHMIDTERIMSYRALRFARNDAAPLPGFEQDDYVANSHHNDLELIDLIEEFAMLRKVNLYLYKSFTDAERQRIGLANGNPTSVYAWLYIIAGHELHHIDILKERY